MNTVATHGRPHCRKAGAVLTALLAALLALAGCDSEPEVTTQGSCDQYLDEGDWDNAIDTCSQIANDEGYSKTAQAYMGRAGVSLLDLIDKIEGTSLAGLSLLLNAFTVNPVQFKALETAIDYLLMIGAPTTTDSFNLLIASDVAISTLLKNTLGITVDSSTGDITIPGITDSGIDQLTASSSATTIQTALKKIYKAKYYSTAPPIWDNANPSAVDLKRISSFVQANAQGAGALELGSLSDLDLSAALDNGKCGLSSGQTASGVNNVADGPKAAYQFPRRLNTSDVTAAYLADELQFVLLNFSGAVDSTREWKGNFLLPSRLLNPDFQGIDCGGGLAVKNFTVCMNGGPVLNSGFTGVRLDDLTTPITCSGGNCEAYPAGWPVAAADGNPGTDDGAVARTDSKTDLAGVLHQLWPVDNTTSSPGTTGSHCKKGDGWVHAREYDYYLRTLGQ